MAHGIEVLIQQVSRGSKKEKTHGAGALQLLAENADNKIEIASAGGVLPLIQLARQGSEEENTRCSCFVEFGHE